MIGIMLPSSGSGAYIAHHRRIRPLVYDHRPVVIIIVDVHDPRVMMMPAERTEKEARRQTDSAAPRNAHVEPRPNVVARPRRPINRPIRRPPPWTIDHHGIIVRHVNYLRV